MKRLLIILVSVFSFVASAAYAETSPQEACYSALKENAVSIPAFSEALQSINALSYSDVEGKFSRYYKDMSSFGIDLDQPLFQSRFYFFGQDTGYRHPPVSPFPSSLQTESWDTNGKEFIIMEEYLTNPEGKNIFISCAFMRISSQDLMKVTNDRYAYDGSMSSIIRTTPTYKAWYNQNDSYDFNGRPFVSWDRLFIYPKATKNDYFDKYSVIDAVPHNTADDFASVWKDTDNSGSLDDQSDENIIVKTVGRRGQIVSMAGAPRELNIPVTNAHTSQFLFYDVFQSIENLYPEFSKHIALRGVLSFLTFKKIVSENDPVKMAYFWRNFMNNDRVSKYYIDKQAGVISSESNNQELETFIAGIPVLDDTLRSVVDSNEASWSIESALENKIAIRLAEIKQWEIGNKQNINKGNNHVVDTDTSSSGSLSTETLPTSSPNMPLYAMIIVIVLVALGIMFTKRR